MQPSPEINRWLQDLRAYSRVALDTNVVIYALEDVAPYRELAQHLLQLVERGLMMASVSTVVEAEVLVKPLRNRDWPYGTSTWRPFLSRTMMSHPGLPFEPVALMTLPAVFGTAGVPVPASCR